MIRIGTLFVLLLIAPAHAQTVAATPGFDPHLVADVYATALAFMAPRTLEPVPVSRLTVWGLRGLTALDPDLTAQVSDGKLRLTQRDRVIATRPAPAEADINGWADAAADLALAAAGTSLPARRGGTQAVVQNFFDELFNHLDVYSRYVPPHEANQDRERRVGQAGTGLHLIRRGSVIVVDAAVADGPGAVAGIRPGDTILSVDGRSARGKDATTVMSWMAGPEATLLTIAWRSHDGRAHSIGIERAIVPPETVFVERTGDLVLIQITEFNRTTDSHLAEAIGQGIAGARPPAGIILDLRGDRGGLLRQAVSAADTLLPAGIVAMTVGRDPEATRVWRSNAGRTGRRRAGRRHGRRPHRQRGGDTRPRAGRPRTGRRDRQFDPGQGPRADHRTPAGRRRNVRHLEPRAGPARLADAELGVLPQVCTSLGQDALSWQLAALAQGRQPMAKALEAHRAARAPLQPAQILAIRNNCPAAEGRDADMAAARLLVHDPAAYAAALLPPLRIDQCAQVSAVSGQAATP